MQRSRKALLQRRALERTSSGKNHLYKISLSLVFILWGLVFLLSLWISRGHGFRDGSGGPRVGISNWDEAEVGHNEGSHSVDQYLLSETVSNNSNVRSCTKDAKTKDLSNSEGDMNYISAVKERVEVENTSNGATSEKDAAKTDRLSRAVPLSLDEFKSKAFTSKVKSGNGHPGSITHKLEPGGTEYNFASASKGAKVLAFNKEAKGASNVLSKDKDKYLRNPCSVDEKFVVIELSEETLVDTIEIANFEHYSSHLKDFVLLGSLVYPSETWVSLGNFTAVNVKHAQRFVLQEPKWVRYLRLNLLSHYGTEFYCTLSVVEVYGVDAVELMLEDLISAQDYRFVSEESTGEKRPVASQPASMEDDDLFQTYASEFEVDTVPENTNVKREVLVNNVPDPVEMRNQQGGRMPGDTVLKILMQKVRSLDLSLSVLERYLEDLNSRYGNILKDIDSEIEDTDVLLETIKLDIKNFLDSKEAIVKDVGDLISWKSLVSLQLDNLVKDNLILRSEVKKVEENQIIMENKGIVVFLICLFFGLLALMRLFVDTVLSVCMALRVCNSEESGKFCSTSSSWFFLLLNCAVVIFILSL